MLWRIIDTQSADDSYVRDPCARQTAAGTSLAIGGSRIDGISVLRTHRDEPMKITSASFLPDQPIPEQFAFGATDPVLHVRLAANHNPQLKWTGAPAETRSFRA